MYIITSILNHIISISEAKDVYYINPCRGGSTHFHKKKGGGFFFILGFQNNLLKKNQKIPRRTFKAKIIKHGKKFTRTKLEILNTQKGGGDCMLVCVNKDMQHVTQNCV